ncbi:hypothetical protein GOP47_0012267 [Adiantum capillus-veneris]|uniref:Uncharacterized protein n=1 Tax=Adiantum capillus-veneris TaxID=13818 RepID=A0A9D4ZGQ0_ADICA|nr:hypothetical protein GOP47_0012267 [Adiantum capillus-veneris]
MAILSAMMIIGGRESRKMQRLQGPHVSMLPGEKKIEGAVTAPKGLVVGRTSQFVAWSPKVWWDLEAAWRAT